MVNHLIPKTLQEALYAINKERYIKVAGGTDLFVQHRMGPMVEPRFEFPAIFLYHLKELNYIKQEDTILIIGGMTPMEDILQHSLVPQCFKEVLKDIASPGIRKMATLAGNIANASPAADSIVYLYAMRATVILMNIDHERAVHIEDMITGVKKTSILPDEIIKEIHVPLHPWTHFSWVKVGGRKSDAISKVSFIGMAEMIEDHIKDLRIAFGAVAPMVISDHVMEDELKGMRLKDLDKSRDALIHHYEALIQPIDDQRSNKTYRKKVALNILNHFLDELIMKGTTP